MDKSELVVGGTYQARVGANITVVRLDSVTKREKTRYSRAATVYSVTNLRTGRTTAFKSSTKFRKRVS